MQEFLEGGEIEDFVADGLAAVDGVLLCGLGFGRRFLAAAGLHGEKEHLAYCSWMPDLRRRGASSKAVVLA